MLSYLVAIIFHAHGSIKMCILSVKKAMRSRHIYIYIYTYIGGWGVSPNRNISMAPAGMMPRLGFWSLINPPGAGRATLFLALVALSLCARVLKRLFMAFARLAAMSKGFKGNVQHNMNSSHMEQ